MLVFLSTGRISCFSMSLILDFWCSDTLGLCWVVLSVAGAVTEPWLGFIYDTEQERSVQLSLESLGMAPRAWERSRKLGNGSESLGVAFTIHRVSWSTGKLFQPMAECSLWVF